MGVGYAYDDKAWPIVTFTFTDRLTAAEMVAYFRDSDALIAGGRRYALVFDALAALTPESAFVRRQAKWTRDNFAAMEQLNAGMAFVINRPVIRGVLRAVLHFQSLPVPYGVHDTMESGTSWARAQIGRASERRVEG